MVTNYPARIALAYSTVTRSAKAHLPHRYGIYLQRMHENSENAWYSSDLRHEAKGWVGTRAALGYPFTPGICLFGVYNDRTSTSLPNTCCERLRCESGHKVTVLQVIAEILANDRLSVPRENQISILYIRLLKNVAKTCKIAVT